MADANPLHPGLFKPEAISPEVKAFNDAFLARMANMPSPGERQDDGAETPSPFGARPKSARASVRKVGANGLEVEVRIVPPASGNPHGAYLHLHGGGLVFGSADQDDAMLERIADATGLASVSVEYRLAPANPYPAAWDDSEAAATWLGVMVVS